MAALMIFTEFALECGESVPPGVTVH